MPFEKNRIRVGFQRRLVVLSGLITGHAVGGGREQADFTWGDLVQAGVKPLAQSFLGCVKAGANVIYAMDHNNIARQVGLDAYSLVVGAIGMQNTFSPPDAIRFFWVCHFDVLPIRQ
ncbi:hypothetical protein C7C56_009585 [Massilia glaciei]|uniref:Uncharacterized protein n=1 Tax=Massilia glaciei TaxID=1524097 RepID=A0A2U2HN21_9BURK|nr:hypothetical protein C7C56_009585 [Massilia glaciei]